MKKIKYIVFTTLILILSAIFSLKVFGAEKYTMQINGASSATKGSNITLTFRAANVASLSDGFSGYSGKVTFDTSKVQFVSATGNISNWDFGKSEASGVVNFLGYDNFGPDNTKRSDVDIFKITFKVLESATGSVTFTANNIKGTTESGMSITADPVSKTITITDPAPAKSNNANLSSLTVSGYSLSPAFNPSTQSYSITVPNNVTSVDVAAVVADTGKATATVTGNNGLSVGKNTVIVEVKAEDGSKKTYQIEVTRKAAETTNPPQNNTPQNNTPTTNTPTTNKPTTTTPAAKSSNNNLKSISGIPGLVFDPNKTEYDITVPFETTSITAVATAQDSKAKITYSNANLNNIIVDKTNTITIAVTAEDSTLKIYTINVKRSPYKSETDLKELVVNKEDIYKDGEDTYKLTVPSDTDKLDISAIPKSEGSTVRIIGGDNLKTGNNTVIVEVTDKNGFRKSYTLNVEKKTDSFLFSFLKDWWLLLLAMLFIFIILGILIYLHNKNKKLLESLANKETQYIPENPVYPNKEVEYTQNPEPIKEEVVPSHIDNTYNIMYNSNNNNTISGTDIDTYIPKHSDDDSVNRLLNDDSVSEVQVVRNETYGDGQLEKERKIIENYRRKK